MLTTPMTEIRGGQEGKLFMDHCDWVRGSSCFMLGQVTWGSLVSIPSVVGSEGLGCCGNSSVVSLFWRRELFSGSALLGGGCYCGCSSAMMCCN